MNDTTITITGNIATDPELKRTANGVAIATFRVAASQRRFDRGSNEWTDGHTNWFTVSAFRTLADHAFASLHKGDRVIVAGRLKIRQWDNGSKQGTAVEIDADAMGHDLLWGTTRFVRDGGGSRLPRAQEGECEGATDPGQESAPDSGADWHVPMTGEDEPAMAVADRPF